MKNILFVICLFLVLVGYGQKSPTLYVGKQKLTLAKLDVKTTIIGTIATTTYDMSFYNATKRVLEGQLKFPLGENQEIVRLALEMNGELREGVVVEKELGRIAFEGVVRKGVDPALLEKGKGNNYNVRIYPIPAKGYKRVVIAYEQELLYKDQAHYYHLPLNFKNPLQSFSVAIEIANQTKRPLLVEGEETMQFSDWQNSYKTSFQRKNYTANKSILLKIPIAIKEEKLITSNNYFYFYKTLTPKQKKRQNPKHISLYWDVSLSMKNRNITKEINLLDAYFNEIAKVVVNFICFSNTIVSKEKFTVKNGDWSLLKEKLLNTVYDGGTSFSEIEKINDKADAILLSSDGMTTLSKTSLVKNTPIFIINSKTTANHKKLHQIAKKTKGAYVNLNTSSNKEGLTSLTTVPFQYLGFSSKKKNIEVYPSISSKGLRDFSVTGKNYTKGEKIIFFFGYGNTITLEIPVVLKSEVNVKDKDIKRIWAKNKLNELVENKKKNKRQIITLATKYGLVTDFTSLIVLEDVQDYIKYDITPPAGLLKAYNRLKNEKQLSSLSPPPPPVNTPKLDKKANGIQLVEDEKKLAETIIETTETDEAEAISIDDIVDVEEVEEVIEDVPFSVIEKAPVFEGCDENTSKTALKNCFSEKIKTHFAENLNTSLANSLGLSPGRKRLFSKFTIDRAGNVVNIKVKAPHTALANEVVRILRLLPKFKPGSQRHRPVNVSYTLPVIFVVEGVTSSGTQNNNTVTVKANTINRNNFRTNTTNNSGSNNPPVKSPPYKKYQGSLQVAERIPEVPYINALRFFKDKKSAYLFYLTQRKSYKEIPHYYIDVADYFLSKFKAKTYADRILSNVIELDVDNYELLRAFAYKLQEQKNYDLALYIYKKIVELRSEDAQSYRDLALAYQDVGLCQKAFDIFLDIVNQKIYKENKHRRMFRGLQDIAEEELQQLYKKYKNDLDKTKIPKNLISKINSIDLRVVVDWNHNDTDIDLHIIDPNLEECYYNHKTTTQGGKISQDMTQGFGPESFTLKKAKKGFYYIKVKYYSDRVQKIETPTFMKITVFKNQGARNEEKITRVIRLSKKDQEEVVEKVEIR